MRHGFWLLLLAVLAPACGSGGGGGSAAPAVFLGAPPSALITTPGGTNYSNVPIAYTLTDAESNSLSVTVEYSSNGGGNWTPAKAGYGNEGVSGLASSPGGTAHTFLWNSVDDAVATVATVVTTARIRITPSDGNAGPAVSTGNFTVNNTGERAMGVVSAVFPHTLTLMGTQEMALGDLVAEAMKTRYGTQLAFQNGWGVRTPLPSGYLPANMALRRNAAGYAAGPPYDLVWADIGAITGLLPFGNRVVTRTVTGAQLWAALENGFSTYPTNNNGFPQIAGFVVTFKSGNVAGSRVQSVVLEGGGAILNDGATYTFATNDFLNAGGDGYTMLNDGQGTPQEFQSQVVADYIQNAGTITPTIAGRIIIVP